MYKSRFCFKSIHVVSNFEKNTPCVGKIVSTDNWIQEIMYWAVKWVHLIWNWAQICGILTAVVKVRVS